MKTVYSHSEARTHFENSVDPVIASKFDGKETKEVTSDEEAAAFYADVSEMPVPEAQPEETATPDEQTTPPPPPPVNNGVTGVPPNGELVTSTAKPEETAPTNGSGGDDHPE